MTHISRRKFIRTSASAAIATAFIPNLISCSKNETVNLAIIGVGGRGTSNWQGLTTERIDTEKQKRILNPNVKIVAFCDVNDVTAAKSYNAKPDIPRFKDFRVMLDQMHKDIDAVVISTPDHTHFAATIAAMELGKHVYVEKPLAHDVWQLRTLKKAEKYYGVVTQLGNQGHASDGIRNIKEWYDQDIIGDVREVHAWFNGPRFDPKGWFNKPTHYPPLAQEIPNTLDWDLWLGPAKGRAYSPEYLPRFWRSYYELGTGMLGDWGCHTLDAPFWSLDLGCPEVIEPTFTKPSADPVQFVSDQSILRYQFPKRETKPAVELTWYEGGWTPENKPEWGFNTMPKNGMIMIGEKTSVFADGKPFDPKLLIADEDWKAFNKKGWNKSIPRLEGPQKAKQYKEFIDAIRGIGPTPGSHFAYGAELTEVCLLGALAQRFNTRIEYDAENIKIKNHPELNQYLKQEVRPGWEYGENLWT